MSVKVQKDNKDELYLEIQAELPEKKRESSLTTLTTM